MHVDPSVHVLASSTLMGGWLPASGVEMPAAYVRTEGKGRVFYSTLGHTEEAWKDPDITKMYFEAIRWALGLTEGSVDSHPRLPGPTQ